MIMNLFTVPSISITLLGFMPLSDVSSIGTVVSQVFLSDQLCPAALIFRYYIRYIHWSL